MNLFKRWLTVLGFFCVFSTTQAQEPSISAQPADTSATQSPPDCPAVMSPENRDQHVRYLRWSLDKLQTQSRDMRQGTPLPGAELDRLAAWSVDESLERGIDNINFAINLAAYSSLALFQKRDPLFIIEMQDYMFKACEETCEYDTLQVARDWVDYVVRPPEDNFLPKDQRNSYYPE